MAKPQQNAQPAQPSRWQGVIDHLNQSHAHMSEAMNLLAQINFDLQRGADFILKYRDSLVGAVEANGGQIEQGSIEQQIADYIPKRPRDEAAQRSPNEE